MRFFLLIAVSSPFLNYAMNDGNQNANTPGAGEIAVRYCCSLLMESAVSRYATAERQRLLVSGSIQQSMEQPSIEERTCRACCARHWGKICCCCTCCCVSVGGGAIAFAGGIKTGIDAIKKAEVGIVGIMQ
jgi:hypothetical protein